MSKIDLGKGLKLGYIAEQVGGELIGNAATRVIELQSFEDAGPKSLSLYVGKSTNRVAKAISTSAAAAVLVDRTANFRQATDATALILVDNPLFAAADLVPIFFNLYKPKPGVSDKADVDPEAKLGKDVHIGAFCSIGPGVQIGDRAVLHPQVVVYPGAIIGEEAVLHSGAVVREHCVVGPQATIQNGAKIGPDGFGFVGDRQRGIVEIPQVGITEIGAGVRVGANSCVDRAALSTTSIGNNTKIDNLVQIGHNNRIGQNVIICAHCAIGGSCKIGNNVVLGGGVKFRDHVSVVDSCRLAGMSGVTQDITVPGDYAGLPVMPGKSWLRLQKILLLLPGSWKSLKKLLKT